jgi:hypothetical protein
MLVHPEPIIHTCTTCSGGNFNHLVVSADETDVTLRVSYMRRRSSEPCFPSYCLVNAVRCVLCAVFQLFMGLVILCMQIGEYMNE